MRIGITQRISKDPDYGELRDALSHDWIDYLTNILPDAVLIPIPNKREVLDHWLNEMRLDALFLSNGNDLGEFSRRDILEERLIRYAVDRLIPVLGFCRGFQILNKYFGGTLTLDLKQAIGVSHVNIEHNVIITDQNFANLMGKEEFKVNSFHNHGVLLDGLSSSLKTFAIAKDSVVEGFFHPELPILGIQWHPERQNNCELENKILIESMMTERKVWQ